MWTVNGVNPNTYGLKVSGVPGWETSPSLDFSTQQVPGRAGTILLRPQPQIGQRRLSVEAVVSGSSNADLLTKLDQLKALLSAPALVVVMDNRPTRQITCRLEGSISVDPGEASMIQRKLPVTFVLVADDPWWYDIALATVASIDSVGVGSSIAVGTAPVWPVVTVTYITGAAASCTIELYNSAGVLKGSITLTHGFVNTNVLVIDMKNKTVKLNGVNHLDYITAGDFFALDAAQHGNYLTAAFPSVRLVSANSTADVTYYKAWR